ncbi:hypothetical protein CC80DRAFT_563327 [Byssothecium circinans]|uniref:Rhodopsin domain-containing protein n=1 Tax=Byssothecium circinans TaxID=147558 RepID=A0A6A5U5Q4_9PLEO|nr:hypothetical protein CC80DRAFT_563327 [Byssothecium circinans]
MIIYWVSIGLGKHAHDVPPDDLVTSLKVLYGTYFLYDVGISLPKLSSLCFYARIFKNPGEPGRCLDYYRWWLGSAISSVIIDAIILIMPLPSLWELHLTMGRKLLVLAVFICGYAVIAISIGRLIANIRAGHELQLYFTYNIIPIGEWLFAETPISIVSVCLPSIFTFVKKGITEGAHSLVSLESKSSPRRLRTPDSEGAHRLARKGTSNDCMEELDMGWNPNLSNEHIEDPPLKIPTGSHKGIDRV